MTNGCVVVKQLSRSKEEAMKNKGFLLAAVALGAAALCFAQGKPYSTAPTDADYRLTIREPLNGATILCSP